jgi:aminoglycoside phosphotransferase family enzyme
MTHPSFVVEDQSEVIAALEKRLAPAKRIDTHGAVVFLSGERAYKLKRAVNFPYMDFSTAERRRAMCEAEIEINRRLAPEIYLGVEPVRTESGLTDWLVVMRRFDEDGLLDRMAERGALTPALMAFARRPDRPLSRRTGADPRWLRPSRGLPPFGGGRHPPDARAGRAARSCGHRGLG